MKPQAPRRTDAFSLGVLILTLAPGVGWGQTMNANSAAYNTGYGRVAGSENQPVDVQMGDSNGNLTVINGLIQGAASGSVFASVTAGASVSGVGSGGSGVASGASATAIGNNLSVVVQGDNNVVVVDSKQTNTGAVTATTTTNGN